MDLVGDGGFGWKYSCCGLGMWLLDVVGAVVVSTLGLGWMDWGSV